MRDSVVHSTQNGNLYLYDARKMFSLLIHPDLGKVHEKSAIPEPYYVRKYEYQKKYGFWGKAEPPDFEIALDESIVKENIIQTRKIVFETTDYCNLNCPYCSLGELYTIGKRDHNKINSRYISYNFRKNTKYLSHIKINLTLLSC